jgi:TonB family protein
MSTLGLNSIAPETVVTGELNLADVLARGVAVEWFEAVAVVRAITEELGRSPDQPSTPDLGQIWLARHGAVRLSGVSYADEPIRRLGQLLQALLNQADPPATLRLIAGNATAPVPIYAGLREFDEAVAYFERPDRPGVLRALLAKAEGHAQVDPAAGQALRSLDDVAPLPARRPTLRPILTRSLRQIVTAVCVGVVTIGAAFLLVRSYRQGERLPVGRLTSAAQQATEAVGGAMLSGISAVTERIGMGSLTAHAESANAAERRGDLKPPARAVSPRGRSASKNTIQAFDLDNQLATTLTPAGSGMMPALLPVDRPAVAARPADVVDKIDTSVYSPEFPNVVPPTAIRPQFPRALPSGLVAANLSRIEVMVLRDGTVESVKLLPGSRQTVKDAMLLSAAKAWQFAPATKDGVPVRYRKTIWIVAE